MFGQNATQRFQSRNTFWRGRDSTPVDAREVAGGADGCFFQQFLHECLLGIRKPSGSYAGVLVTSRDFKTSPREYRDALYERCQSQFLDAMSNPAARKLFSPR